MMKAGIPPGNIASATPRSENTFYIIQLLTTQVNP